MINVFLITAHKNFDQLNKLLHLLATGDDHVIIHIDKRSDELFRDIKQAASQLKNVQILEKRYVVYWGSYNQIKATTALIKAASEIKTVDYVHLISGQDLPAMDKVGMNQFLCENNGSEFIECIALPNSKWNRNGGLDRIEMYWFDGLLSRFTYRTHIIQNALKYRRNSKRYKFYGGANWFTLTAASIKWISNYIADNPQYLRRYKFTRNADEIFVQTLLMMSPFASKIVSDDLRYTNWHDGPEFPRTLRKEDFDMIFQSDNKLFARKFDEAVDRDIIDLVIDKVSERKEQVS